MTIIKNLLLIVLLTAACGRQAPAELRVDLESNKTVARHWFDDGFNKGNLKAVDDAFAEFVNVNGTVVPRDVLKQSMSRHLAAFPDLHVTIDTVIGEENNVAVWYTAEGTHRGTFDNFPSTGKHLQWTGADLLTFEQGRISKAFFQSELPIRLAATKNVEH